MARKSKKIATTYDIEFVKSAARGRWPEIISTIARIDAEALDGKHHPCPKCGGTDRFRMIDADAGALLCNKCFSSNNGDGFQAIQWANGVKFVEALQLVANHLGIEPTKSPANSTSASGKQKKTPPGHTKLIDAIYSYGQFLARKESINLEKSVLIYPYRTDENDKIEPTFNVVRYELKDSKGKRFCPFHFRQSDKKWYSGDPPGKLPLYELPCIKNEPHVYICEGEKAVDAIRELHLPATTTAHGSKSAGRTDLTPLAGKRITILRDNDDDGKHYAATLVNLLAALSPPATTVVKLLPDLPAKGDAHDFIAANRLFGLPDDEIIALIESTPIDEETMAAAKATTGQPGQATASGAIEHDDDPHRLARINLERYAATEGGATIRYWRDEWYTWKPSRGCYKKISVEDLRAKLSQTIKIEFDRINIEKQAEQWRDEPPKAQKVTKALVTNVLDATKSLCLIPSSVELMSWVDSGHTSHRQRRNYIAMRNGILDLDRLLEDREGDTLADVLLPYSPAWFSTTCLPYDFDLNSKCPKWDKFLEKNLELDPERIKILQEWAGYLLLPETGQQRFLALEGEGANGKSVYCAAITAMLGIDNCSYVSVEGLSDKFVRTQTIGRLVNVCPDVGEIDKANEGDLKSFVSGDVMFFDRKHMSGLNCTPTARLMMSFNNRPRFSDRSMGIWRRMMLIPFNVQIAPYERIPNMDKHSWWEASGELPGIFLWAIAGLHRLRQQGRFTRSDLSDLAIEDYRAESNPARAFLLECFEESENAKVPSASIYKFYRAWADQNGYRALGERVFGKEINRVYSNAIRRKGGKTGNRYWYYEGISFSQEEIAGRPTRDEWLLFND